MSAATPTLHSTPLSRRVTDVIETVRWAPAPPWGRSAADHTRYLVYLAGSMLIWTVIGLGAAALIGLGLALLG
ncbi:chemotaxis protein CheW [Cellulomonas sp. ICMP 17802]|uniref:chemotaxis protein CheW n=1 Tax=Cellulomonas sp. ICMP 17802 TaxID=3239199 RepID=UPI00351ABFCB